MNDWLHVVIPFGALLVGVAAVVLYVWSLVNAAKNGKWVWFVLILLVGPLCVAYALFADKHPPDSN